LIRILFVVAIAIFAITLLWRVQQLPPHQRRAGVIQLILMLAVVLVVWLTVTGRMHWVGAALTGAFVFLRQTLPWVLRALPFLQRWRQSQSSGSGQSSIQTSFLYATLDHDTGNISGEVISGLHEGWRLDDLSTEQLEGLLAQYSGDDPESAELLRAYLAQRNDWEDQEAEQRSEQAQAAQAMNSKAEALATLGLDDTASEEDIVAAHRSLIQKLHPDRGGNDYLAAKINQAKDFLLND
jgi:hypothetical protein